MRTGNYGEPHLLYETEYRQQGRKFSMQIVAQDADHAAHLCLRRGIGEQVNWLFPAKKGGHSLMYGVANLLDAWQGPGDTTGTLEAAIHEASVLCFVALSAGTAKLEDTLGDYGLLHNMTHMLTGDPDWKHQQAQCRVAAFNIERDTPGWPTGDWQAPMESFTCGR